MATDNLDTRIDGLEKAVGETFQPWQREIIKRVLASPDSRVFLTMPPRRRTSLWDRALDAAAAGETPDVFLVW